MTFKKFWKENKKGYFISTGIGIFIGILGYVFQCSRNKTPIHLMTFFWLIPFSFILIFILMCIIGAVIGAFSGGND